MIDIRFKGGVIMDVINPEQVRDRHNAPPSRFFTALNLSFSLLLGSYC